MQRFTHRLVITIALLGALLAFPANVLASCRTHSYTINGRYTTCTTCCFAGNCTTNCF